jgi:iron complex transport system substrate-binding protein
MIFYFLKNVCIYIDKGIVNKNMNNNHKRILPIVAFIIFMLGILGAAYLGGLVKHLELGGFGEDSQIYSGYPRTITDSAGRNVTIHMPIKRIITLTSDSAEAVRTLGEVDNIVGVTETIKIDGKEYFPELEDKPSVGTWKEFDYEKIVDIAMNNTDDIVPDILVISFVYKVSGVEEGLSLFDNIAVIGLDLYKGETLEDELIKLGYILEREDEVQDFINWYADKGEAVIRAVSGLDRPKVYIERGYTNPGESEFKTYGEGSAINEHCEEAGGDNIAKDRKHPATVEWEWVIDGNPDVIVKEIPETSLPDWVDTSVAEEKRNEVMNRIGAENITAIENGSVYVHIRSINFGSQRVVGLTYWAKIFHPDVDLDPEAVYREYLEYQGMEYPEDRIIVYGG